MRLVISSSKGTKPPMKGFSTTTILCLLLDLFTNLFTMKGIIAAIKHLLWILDTHFLGTPRHQQECVRIRVEHGGQYPNQAHRH